MKRSTFSEYPLAMDFAEYAEDALTAAAIALPPSATAVAKKKRRAAAAKIVPQPPVPGASSEPDIIEAVPREAEFAEDDGARGRPTRLLILLAAGAAAYYGARRVAPGLWAAIRNLF